jgi:hypothetical protein
MKKITMSEEDKQAFKRALALARDWSRQHQAEVGVLEGALGASLLALAVHNGVIRMGVDMVGSAMSGFNTESGVGGAIGGAVGAAAGKLLGSIGIAAGGTAIAVPAGLLIGGGALLLGALGYACGDILHNYLHPPFSLDQLIGNASLLAVGLALLIDGARRIAVDSRVREAASRVRSGVIYLREVAVAVVARSMSELERWMRGQAADLVATAGPAGGLGAAGAVAAGGLAVGSSIAASSVTVLGSHALGTAALSLGLVSAPLWPVILCGAAGLGIGFAGWKAIKTFAADSDS